MGFVYYMEININNRLLFILDQEDNFRKKIDEYIGKAVSFIFKRIYQGSGKRFNGFEWIAKIKEI